MFYELGLPPVRIDLYLQRYILHLHRYFTSEYQNYKYKIYISLEQLRMKHMQRTCAINCFAVLWFSLPSLSKSASIFLIWATCFFGGMMANFDINVYIFTLEKLFHPCKIGRATYCVRLITYNAGRAPYDVRPGIGWCYHIETPAGTRAICDHVMLRSQIKLTSYDFSDLIIVRAQDDF